MYWLVFKRLQELREEYAAMSWSVDEYRTECTWLYEWYMALWYVFHFHSITVIFWAQFCYLGKHIMYWWIVFWCDCRVQIFLLMYAVMWVCTWCFISTRLSLLQTPRARWFISLVYNHFNSLAVINIQFNFLVLNMNQYHSILECMFMSQHHWTRIIFFDSLWPRQSETRINSIILPQLESI